MAKFKPNISVLQKLMPYLLASIVIFIVWYVLVQPIRNNQGMWYSHDDVQVVRTQEMVKELRRGQFPVRMVYDFGNGGGYMLFNYYSPLTYYITALLVILGAIPLNAVKLLFQFCFVLGSFGTFLYVRYLTKSKYLLPLFGSVIFLTSAYFLYDVFIRGALAETLGFALVPLVFLAMEILLRSRKSILPIIFFSAILALLIYAHAIPAICFLMFLCLRLLVAVVCKEKVRYASLLMGIGLSFLLASSFLLPLVTESPFVKYSQSDFVNLGFASAFVPLQDSFGFIGIHSEFVPKSIGICLSLLLLFSMLILIRHLSQKRLRITPIMIFLFLGLLLSIFLQSHISSFLWENILLLKLLQFPYRILVFSTFFALTISMIGLSVIRSKAVIILLISLYLMGIFMLQRQFLQPTGYYFSADFKAEDSCSTTSWQQELLATWVIECLPKNTTELIAQDNQVTITAKDESPKKIITLLTQGSAGNLVVNRYYFPGWKVIVDGQQVATFSSGKSGLLTAQIPSGSHTIEIYFTNTTVRAISNVLTLFGISILAILMVTYLYSSYRRFTAIDTDLLRDTKVVF